MGFFDFLRSTKQDSKRSLNFEELKDFFIKNEIRLKKEKEKILESEIRSINKHIKDISSDLDSLESEGIPDGLHKKLSKILSTNQPLYIGSMRKIMENLESLETEVDPDAFSRQFKDLVEMISKEGFGEGRYLPAAHPTIMKNIQLSSKRLFDIQKELDDELGLGEDEKKIFDAREKYHLIISLSGQLKDLKASVTDVSKDISNSKKELSDLEKSMNDITRRISSGEVSKIKKELEGLKAEIGENEDMVFSSVSKLGKGLRKYSKISLTDEKNIDRLLENPVAQFLEMDLEDLRRILENFKESVKRGDIQLKDSDKMLAKGQNAIETLTSERKGKLTLLRSRERDLSNRMESMEIFKKEKKTSNSIISTSNLIEGYEVKNKEYSNTIKEVERLQFEGLNELREMLSAMDIDLTD